MASWVCSAVIFKKQTFLQYVSWVLPNRERIYAYFCNEFKDSKESTEYSAACNSSVEVDVSPNNPAFEEFTDSELQVTR